MSEPPPNYADDAIFIQKYSLELSNGLKMANSCYFS